MKKEKKYLVDRFADIKILRYFVSDFESLPVKQKLLIYFLSEAALWGRDIFWHQNCEEGLQLRSFLEQVYIYKKRNNGGVDASFEKYVKQVWFANGPHHHYSNDKFAVGFSSEQLHLWAKEAGVESLLSEDIEKLIFDPQYKPKKVSLDANSDVIQNSSVNFYKGVSQIQAEQFYASGKGHPLNSRLCLTADGNLQEQLWTENGMYGAYISRIIYCLREAEKYVCNETQGQAIRLLIEYYQKGEPAVFDEYNKTWVQDKESVVDFINGFIEVYNDPLGLKATWESIVELCNTSATNKAKKIANVAQWAEDNSPVAAEYKKANVRGVSMKIIEAVMLGGDCYPSTPIGVNLPNADWIREQYGSKSILLSNITRAYSEAASGSGSLEEFAASAEEVARHKKYGRESDDLHTLLHECLGHGSGQMRNGVSLDALKTYGSTIEEARADLYALYFMADNKMIELGLLPCKEAAWTHYDSYMRNGILVQLARISKGQKIEEAHMRNRALIARWSLEKGRQNGACDMIVRGGKHYVVIKDYEQMRQIFGSLLREVQRIKSEGDIVEAQNLVENYGVSIDLELHQEIIERYEKLDIAPFSGFVNPVLTPIITDGQITDVDISYEEMFDEQMLRYSQQYSLGVW